MWPDVPTNSIWLLTMAGRCYGQRILNTFGYQVVELTGAEKPVDAVTQAFFADADYADFQTDFLLCLPEAYQLEEVWLQMIFPFRVRKGIFEAAADGQIPGEALVQSQACISRHSVTAARWANGGVRLMMPAGSDYSANGLITAGHKAVLQIFAGEMEEDINITVTGSAYKFRPSIIHPGATPGSFSATAVVETNVQDQLRTQRTRVVGRGE